jgi:HK97 family phage portal protein
VEVDRLMRIFGFDIVRAKAAPPVPVYENRGGWYPLIRESYTGAWQHNVTVDRNTVLSFPAVYSCITLISSDIAKLRVKLVEQDADGIWSETESAAFSPVLRKPNRYQTSIQFWEAWLLSKLTRGNTYVLKERDGRGVVVALYVLAPDRVKPMVADDGSVWYQLSADNMAGGELMNETIVPASEVIHDRFNCLYHPLIGTSPLYAAGVAAMQGIAIQNNSTRFFNNAAQPGGILTAPGEISDDTANRLKALWESKFSGENAGKIAVVGDGLTYKALAMTAEESQLIDQLKWTGEVVCSVYHVPAYKVGFGPLPSYNNVQALNVEYYTQALQGLIEAAELCLDEGLGIGRGVKIDGKVYGTEFDVDNLLRMDSVTQMEMLDKSKGVLSPNEQRAKLDKKPVSGGASPMVQQQNYSLEALAKRDAGPDPFGTAKAEPPQAPAEPDLPQADKALFMRAVLRKELGLAA